MKPSTKCGIWNLVWMAVIGGAGYLSECYAIVHHVRPLWKGVIGCATMAGFLVMVIVGFVMFGELE
jgi:hypothetical protein